MIAVDTNILVRLVTGDDQSQVERILALAAEERFFVSLTVLMETEWVLRSRFGYDRSTIYKAFEALPNLVSMDFEDEEGVAWALDRFEIAGELADYLHIVAARKIGRFVTFEKNLTDRAGQNAPARTATVP